MREELAARGSEEKHPVAPTFGRLSLLRKQVVGEILASPERRERLAARLFARAHREGECLLWDGCRIPTGYGTIFVAKAEGEHLKDGAHRIALALKLGRPLELDALHSCNNPRCIEAEHLSEGTHSQNLGQMVREGRSSHGEQRWSAKLTEADVREMRRLAGAGVRGAELSRRFGASSAQVSRIIRGENWKHVSTEAA